MVTLSEVLRDRAERDGDRVMFDFADRSYTYRDVQARAGTWQLILSDAGAQPGARIVFLSANRPEFVFALYGALAAGRSGRVVQPGLEGRRDRARVRRGDAAARASRTPQGGRRSQKPRRSCRRSPRRPAGALESHRGLAARRCRRRRGARVQLGHDRASRRRCATPTARWATAWSTGSPRSA